MIEIDEKTDFGKRVLRRLEEESVIWLTTVSEDESPHPRPVWFYWDGERFHIYSRPDTYKLEHLEAHPEVALNFDSDGEGGDIVVFLGEAEIREDLPPANELAPYTEKYADDMQGLGMTPEEFAASYSVPIRVTPTKVRGH
ncbi:MAG: TIGR03667 family PPOX class F420-dependent oxidoreductase [Anaerolineales bacterium]